MSLEFAFLPESALGAQEGLACASNDGSAHVSFSAAQSAEPALTFRGSVQERRLELVLLFDGTAFSLERVDTSMHLLHARGEHFVGTSRPARPAKRRLGPALAPRAKRVRGKGGEVSASAVSQAGEEARPET